MRDSYCSCFSAYYCNVHNDVAPCDRTLCPMHNWTLNTHNLVYKTNRTLVVQIRCHKLGVKAGSNHEGSCHSSSASYHTCKSELCTLGAGETASLVVVMTKCTVCIVLYHILASYSGHLCPGYKAISYPGHLSWVSQLTASLHLLLHCLLTSRVSPQSPTCRRFRSSWRRRGRSLRRTNIRERPGVPPTMQVCISEWCSQSSAP